MTHRAPKPQVILNALSKEYRALAKSAPAAGWSLSMSRGGHAKLTSPDGLACPLPSSSRAPRTFLAVRAQLRRAGLDV